MNTVVILLLGMIIGFGLGWISKPKYSPTMSRVNQILLVAGTTLVVGVVGALTLGETGWTVVAIGVLLPVAMVAPYFGGFLRERAKSGR